MVECHLLDFRFHPPLIFDQSTVGKVVAYITPLRIPDVGPGQEQIGKQFLPH